MTWHLMALRYGGQTLIEALHDAVEAGDHQAARDIAVAAYRSGVSDAAQDARLNAICDERRGGHFVRMDGIGSMGE